MPKEISIGVSNLFLPLTNWASYLASYALVFSSKKGGGLLIRVITHPSYSGTVLVYTIILACHPVSAPFHSQQYPGLNKKSYGHPTSEGYED